MRKLSENLGTLFATKVNTIYPKIAHEKGAKILAKRPIFDEPSVGDLLMRLNAISRKGIRIHQACANCQIKKINIRPKLRNLSTFRSYML